MRELVESAELVVVGTVTEMTDMGSGSTGCRRGGDYHGLARAIGTRRDEANSLRALGRALNDSDFGVRLNAVRALDKVVGEEPRVVEDHFRENEGQYVDSWKARLLEQGVDTR